MKWRCWINVFTETHCTARGLRPKTIAAYKKVLEQYYEYARLHIRDTPPDAMRARDVLAYVQHLREVRENGDSAVNRAVTILKVFYRAMVAMDYMNSPDNPMTAFPMIKATSQKLPIFLTEKEVSRLMNKPTKDTVIGIRDRAILALLYGTGIRATECSTLTDKAVDLESNHITVIGKGGHERCVPLNEHVVKVLDIYRRQRGLVMPETAFFRCRNGTAMQRRTIYERVSTWGVRAHLIKRISPHKLRHTFATHLLQKGVGLVTLRDLLGHRQITSTQVYLHVTAQDLRRAADKHPIGKLLNTVQHILPHVQLPMQHAPRKLLYA